MLRVPERFTVVPAPDGSFRLHSLTFSLELRGGRGDLLGRLLALLDRERPWAEVLAAFEPDDRPRAEPSSSCSSYSWCRPRGNVRLPCRHLAKGAPG